MSQKEEWKIWIAALGILMVLLSCGTIFYFNNQIDSMKQTNLLLAKQIESGLLNLHKSLSNLSDTVGIVDFNLENFKKQSQQEITTLMELVDEIEKQSNIQLSELKDELKNVQVKSADFSAIIDDVLSSVVSITTNRAQGSGVIVHDGNYIVTNLHVISGAARIRVTTNNGDTYDIDTVAGVSTDADIAVLVLNEDLTPLPFGDSSKLKIGEKVIAAGNPAGLSFTVTEGIVSAFRTFSGIDYVQSDVPINPGNSGGPLINVKGEIVGINNFKAGGFEGLGFAIASNDVEDVSERIIENYEAQLVQTNG